MERYRNLKIFNGDPEDNVEFSPRLRSQVVAGDARVERLMKAVENDCMEDRLALNMFDECSPQFYEKESEFVGDVQLLAEPGHE